VAEGEGSITLVEKSQGDHMGNVIGKKTVNVRYISD
jgi:transcription antitermination factor NusA-like protein